MHGNLTRLLHFLFFFPLLLPFSFCSTKPPLTSASRATLLMHLNLSGPSLTPPYHLVTTTTTLETSISCMSCNNLPPAADSPSSSELCIMVSGDLGLPGDWMRQAVMLCEAVATFLFEEIRSAMDDVAAERDSTGRHRAMNVDLFTANGLETVQLAGVVAETPEMVSSRWSAAINRYLKHCWWRRANLLV